MRAAFAAFLLLHGLAHLVGFLLPWHLIPSPARGAAPAPPTNVIFGHVHLADSTARLVGILWLMVALAFVVVAIGVWREMPWSRTALVVMLLASLALTSAWWPTARIGVLINLAILFGLLMLGYRAYVSDVRVERARALSDGTIVQTSAGPIEYVTIGTGDPVLVVHGTGGGWDQGLYASRGLAPFGFQLIAPSRFGYLGTPMPPDHSPRAEADAFAALLDELGIDRVAVMSFSAGTAPAVQFALQHPERVSALVLVVPGAGGMAPMVPKGPPAWVMNVVLRYDLPMWLAMRLAPKVMYRVVAVPASLVPGLAPADSVTLHESIRMILPVSLRRKGMINDAMNMSGWLPLFPLDSIAVPTLLVSAEDDLYQTMKVARRAAAIIPGAQLIGFETGGHLLLGRANEMWPRVASFLHAAPQTSAELDEFARALEHANHP
jgi:2-hydroxy-6-oxonona-2,4-dienedioate hydrolase